MVIRPLVLTLVIKTIVFPFGELGSVFVVSIGIDPAVFIVFPLKCNPGLPAGAEARAVLGYLRHD
jgi:hypothetical protein